MKQRILITVVGLLAFSSVFKFYESKTLVEIVYKPHAGRWKVYEIAFRY